MTSHEIALNFTERFQQEYPNTPIHELIEGLRQAIDDHVQSVDLADVGGAMKTKETKRDWALDNEKPTELDEAVNFLNSRPHLYKNGQIDRYALGRIMLEWSSQKSSKRGKNKTCKKVGVLKWLRGQIANLLS